MQDEECMPCIGYSLSLMQASCLLVASCAANVWRHWLTPVHERMDVAVRKHPISLCSQARQLGHQWTMRASSTTNCTVLLLVSICLISAAHGQRLLSRTARARARPGVKPCKPCTIGCLSNFSDTMHLVICRYYNTSYIYQLTESRQYTATARGKCP
jgi:hypothetical protein